MTMDESRNEEGGSSNGAPPAVQMDPSRRMEEKMDKDFLYFLSYIPITFKNIKDENDKHRCREWLKRLMENRPLTVNGKRNRNRYMVNLILQMGESQFKPPFDEPPPKGKLKSAGFYFGGMEAPMPCSDDLNFDIDDYSEFSRDGRTYLATKALLGGRGAFAYLGISNGGGDTVWVNAAGEPVCPEELDKSRKEHSAGQKNSETEAVVEKILNNRSPCPDRGSLVQFYEGVLNQLNETIQSYGTDQETSDPVIERMIEDLQVEDIKAGRLDLNLTGCFTKLHWLQRLLQKVKEKLTRAVERQNMLTTLENEFSNKHDITFLDLSNSIKSTKVDPMFDEAARDRPSQHHVELLKRNYPECIVQKLLMLLEKEKFDVIRQQKEIYQDFILQLKNEIMTVVRKGLDRYLIARKEWKRVVTVLRHIEEEKTRILEEYQESFVSADPQFIQKDALLSDEIETAKRKLQESQCKCDQVEERLAALHEQIHRIAAEYERMEKEAQDANKRFQEEICKLQKLISAQDRKIRMLEAELEQKQKIKSCSRK